MNKDTNGAGQTVPLDSLVRCPECIDGPIPGCVYDYSGTHERWETCSRCDGSGKIEANNENMSGAR